MIIGMTDGNAILSLGLDDLKMKLNGEGGLSTAFAEVGARAVKASDDGVIAADKVKESWVNGLTAAANASKSVFEEIGAGLMNGEIDWNNVGKAAVRSIGKIISALGDQLAAQAAVKTVEAFAALATIFTAWLAPGLFSAAGILAAGATAAWITGGALQSYEDGTSYAPGGVALVGERGPELVNLPQGSTVTPNGLTPSSSGGTVINFYSPTAIDVVQADNMLRSSMRQMAFAGGL
jgi:hypothetical protein